MSGDSWVEGFTDYVQVLKGVTGSVQLLKGVKDYVQVLKGVEDYVQVLKGGSHILYQVLKGVTFSCVYAVHTMVGDSHGREFPW